MGVWRHRVDALLYRRKRPIESSYLCPQMSAVNTLQARAVPGGGDVMDSIIVLNNLTAVIAGGTLAFFGLIGNTRHQVEESNPTLPGEMNTIGFSTWTQYSSSQHNFIVDLPSAPTVRGAPNTTGELSIFDTTYKVDSRGMTLWIQVLEYPGHLIDIMSDPRSYLAVFCDVLALDPGSSVSAFDNSIEFLGNPAATAEIVKLSEGKMLAMYFLCFAKDNTIYELATEGDSQGEPQIQLTFSRFTDSFHFK